MTTTDDDVAVEQLYPDVAAKGLIPLPRVRGDLTPPLTAYCSEHTDAALTARLELAAAGYAGAAGPGHAAVRFTNPANGSAPS